MSPAPPSTTTRRAHRRRLVALVAVGALASIAATCQAAKPPAPPPPPPPPSVYCHPPGTPTNAAGYQAAFDGLRAANTAGWVANDGGLPVRLTDGRTVWMFGDTIIGASQQLPASVLTMANNGFAVQQGSCFTPISEPIKDPSANEWIWPTGAVQQNNNLLVFGLHMRRGGSPPFDFQLESVDVARFSLSNLNSPVSVTPLPLPSSPTYGETILVDNNFVYAYGQKRERNPIPNSFPIPTHYVARASLGSMPGGPWEFWSGDPLLGNAGWVTIAPNPPIPMLFDNPAEGAPGPSPVEGPLAGFAVGRDGGYVGSSFMIDVFSNDAIWSWDSTAPQGPWIRRDTPAVDINNHNIDYPPRFAYGGRVVTNIPGSSPIGLWSTNHESFDAVLANPNLYKVWFAPPVLP